MVRELTPLKVDDADFLVHSMVARCPRNMMVRELIMNAMEAALLAKGERMITVYPVEINGVRKLAIKNPGPGMTKYELYAICDIGSSLRKLKNNDDGNLGAGGKLASLGANPEGVRYRSCHDRKVFEVILGKRGEYYGRLLIRDRSGLSEIRDVTDDILAQNISVDEDWTEVVLMGASAQHDTVAHPYEEGVTPGLGWLEEALRSRFFDVSPMVTIRLLSGLSSAAEAQEFVPMSRIGPGAIIRSETSLAESSLAFHFYQLNPDVSSRLGLRGGVALLYRGELYDWEQGASWAYNSPSYGIPFAAADYVVLVELLQSFPLKIEQYRQFLTYADGSGKKIEARSFSDQIRLNRPQWLLDSIEEQASKRRGGAATEKTLADLAREISVASGGEPIDPPQVYVLRDKAELAERWLDARAAKFEVATNELFVNANYGSISRFARDLAESVDVIDASLDEAKLRRMAENAFVEKIARTVVRVLGRAKSRSWTAGNLEKALSGEALSLAAEDLENELMRMRGRIAAGSQNQSAATA